MNKTKRFATASLLLAAILLASATLSGCDGFQLPTVPPQSPAASTAPPASAPAGETVAPTGEPSPSPDGTAPAAASPDPTATLEPTIEPTIEPTATPLPTATPAPTTPPGPWNDGDRPDVEVTKYYATTLPEGLKNSLKYNKYPAWLNYFVVMKSSNIRELPNAKAKSLASVRLAQRYELLAQVKGADGADWYRVRVSAKGAVGYIPASAGTPKAFQVGKSLARIEALKRMADLPGTVRVSNYKNRNGKPPQLPSKKEADEHGYLRDQAAPAYLAPDKTSSFRYAPDGTMAQLLGTSGDYSQVYIPTFDEVRYIPSKYIYGAKTDQIESLTQVAVVDRKYQNIMTFEYIDGQWNVVSYCYISTGKNSGYAKPTPVGDFIAIEKKKAGKYGLGEFWYLADGADPGAEDLKFEGYAPYAVRFTGGAYLHGLPRGVSYTTDPVTGESTLVMPKALTTESYGTFLGVRPESHMCVRNYTSHAKYMWQWFKIGSGAVLVIE